MENKICEFCNKEIQEKYNFCPYCGEAQTELAKMIERKNRTNAQLELVLKLIDNTTDEKTLAILQEFVNEAKKNN